MDGAFVSAPGGRLITPGFRYVTSVHGVLGLYARRDALYRVVDLAAGRASQAVIAVSRDARLPLLLKIQGIDHRPAQMESPSGQ